MADINFSDLHLTKLLTKTILELKFQNPTEIQIQAIPLALEGHDIIIQAQTGSGKTAAFVLPILHKLNDDFQECAQALVLVPTRELAIQVSDVFKSLGKHLQPRQNVLPLIGGENVDQQSNSLKRTRQILVATPGRLVELLDLNRISLKEIKFLVFDEADKILNSGFASEINVILEKLPKNKQCYFVSATFPEKLQNLISIVSGNPKHIKVENSLLTNQSENVEPNIIQRAIEVNIENRGPLLRHLIKEENWEHVLVFVASKKAATNVTSKLKKLSINAEEFHGDLNQDQRNSVLKKFIEKKIRVLVSTDLTSRGIDILELSHVVNYDLPRSPNDYIHRIGRTGRAGKSGQAVSFITDENEAHFKLIEKKNKIKISREQIKGFEKI